MSATTDTNIVQLPQGGRAVEVPTGDEVRVPTSERFEPQIISIKRGPYIAHVVVVEEEGEFEVQIPIHVQQIRPALLTADSFFNFTKMRDATNKIELRGTFL